MRVGFFIFFVLLKAKQNREWRHEYMTLLMRDQENREIGREEGKIYGAISAYHDLGLSDAKIIQKLQEKFKLDKQEAEKYLQIEIL